MVCTPGMDWQPSPGAGPPSPTRWVYEDLPEFLPEESGATRMSAAEPADPTMPELTTLGGAAVIDFSTRAHAIRRTDSGRRKPMSTPQPDGDPGGGPSLQQQLAEHFEVTFNNHHLTLTDEMTATAWAVTLEIVRGMLQGAEAEGIVDAGQRRELDAMIEGMKGAPRLVEQSV